MLSFWSKKPVVTPTDDRQLHRGPRKNGDGVLYASKNKDRGVTFTFSGPAGSRHSDEALKIAGRIYSNQNMDDYEDRSEVPAPKKRRGDDDEVERAQPEVITREPKSAKNPNKQEERVAEASGGRRRHKLSSDEAEAVFRAAPSNKSRAAPSNRHASVPSNVSQMGSVTGTQVATNRHGGSLAGTGFKHENESHLSYGMQNGGSKILVSVPKHSDEAKNLRQVAEMATRSGQATIVEGDRHSARGLLK